MFTFEHINTQRQVAVAILCTVHLRKGTKIAVQSACKNATVG